MNDRQPKGQDFELNRRIAGSSTRRPDPAVREVLVGKAKRILRRAAKMIGFDPTPNQFGRDLVIHIPAPTSAQPLMASITSALRDQKETYLYYVMPEASAKRGETCNDFQDDVRRAMYQSAANDIGKCEFERILVIPSRFLDIAARIAAADITGTPKAFIWEWDRRRTAVQGPDSDTLRLDFRQIFKPMHAFVFLQKSRLFEEYLKRCKDVPGFVTPESIAVWDCLLAFQQHRQLSGPLLEIGVYYGKSAMMLAMHASEADELFLVDCTDFVDSAEVLVKTFKPAGVVVFKQKSSQGAVWSLASSHTHLFRWVHVDGDHKAETVWTDLELGNRLLADEGILCVDDFLNPRYPQLTYAVCTFLEKHRAELQMFLCGFNKAYLVRPNALFRHLRFVKEDLGTKLSLLGIKEITIYKTDYPSVLNCFGIGSRWGDFLYYGLDEDPAQVLI